MAKVTKTRGDFDSFLDGSYCEECGSANTRFLHYERAEGCEDCRESDSGVCNLPVCCDCGGMAFYEPELAGVGRK